MFYCSHRSKTTEEQVEYSWYSYDTLKYTEKKINPPKAPYSILKGHIQYVIDVYVKVPCIVHGTLTVDVHMSCDYKTSLVLY